MGILKKIKFLNLFRMSICLGVFIILALSDLSAQPGSMEDHYDQLFLECLHQSARLQCEERARQDWGDAIDDCDEMQNPDEMRECWQNANTAYDMEMALCSQRLSPSEYIRVYDACEREAYFTPDGTPLIPNLVDNP